MDETLDVDLSRNSIISESYSDVQWVGTGGAKGDDDSFTTAVWLAAAIRSRGYGGIANAYPEGL